MILKGQRSRIDSSAVLVCILALASTVAVAEAPVEASTHPQRGCIYINGNSEFTTDHGVTGGSGTGPDPYIIEGWEIKGCFDGIHIQNTDAHLIIRNVYVHSVDQFGSAILLFNVANAVIDNVTLKGSDGWGYSGIRAASSSNIIVSNSDITDFPDGIVSYPGNTSILGNYFANSGVAVYGENFTVTGNNFSGKLLLDSARDTIISGNLFRRGGIELRGDSLAHYNSHEISDNWVNGKPLYFYKDCRGVEIDHIEAGQIILANCTNVRLSNLEISNTLSGVQMAFVNESSIADSNLHSNWLGLHVRYSTNVTISHSRISNNTDTGIVVANSIDLLLMDNIVSLNGYLGISVRYSSHVVLSGNMISSNYRGIKIGVSSDVSVLGNVVQGHWDGIEVNSSTRTVVMSNNVSDGALGITVAYSGDQDGEEAGNVTVSDNAISSNGIAGIYVVGSNTASIIRNHVADNGFDRGGSQGGGIVLFLSVNIRANHNNLVNNLVQAVDKEIPGRPNRWDSGYPSGGNYWSDYGGVDVCGGVNQDVCSGPDGLGDKAYDIDSDTQDRYPLMEPYSVLSAQVNLDPDVITFRARGRHLTAYIELPALFDADNIDPSSIRLNGTIARTSGTPVIMGDNDGDGIRDIMVKFDLDEVRALFSGRGSYTLEVSGTTKVGSWPFRGFDSIRYRV